jgi:hypothetical protein
METIGSQLNDISFLVLCFYKPGVPRHFRKVFTTSERWKQTEINWGGRLDRDKAAGNWIKICRKRLAVWLSGRTIG